MKALYRKYYRPDRAKIIVVGPVDPVAIERQIVAKFADWKNDGAPAGRYRHLSVDTSRKLPRRQSLPIPKSAKPSRVQQIVADKKRPDTIDRAMMELKMQIASGIISQRISRRSREADVPFLGGGLSFHIGFCDQYARIGINASAKDGSWREVLPFVEQIVRQAAEYGFSEAEVAEQIRRLNAAYENAAKSEATRPSSGFANELVGVDDETSTPQLTVSCFGFSCARS